MRKFKFFADFVDTEIWETLGISRSLSMGTGKTVVQQGEAGGNLYIITSGEVVVIQNGVEINRMEAGDCFGNIAYQDEALHVHTASVTVSKSIDVIEIQGRSLREASDSLQARFSKALLSLMVAQMRKADQRILTMMCIE